MSDSLATREANAIAWYFSGAAGDLTLDEARYVIQERFGRDVDESLQRRFSKIKVTEAKATVPVTPPVAVESPDDWVEITDPGHVLLKVCYEVENSHGEFISVHGSSGKRLGSTGYTKARCRRKDLPVPTTPLSQQKPTRVSVRLWCMDCNFESGGSSVTAKPDIPDRHGDWREILHDADGFYVETSE